MSRNLDFMLKIESDLILDSDNKDCLCDVVEPPEVDWLISNLNDQYLSNLIYFMDMFGISNDYLIDVLNSLLQWPLSNMGINIEKRVLFFWEINLLDQLNDFIVVPDPWDLFMLQYSEKAGRVALNTKIAYKERFFTESHIIEQDVLANTNEDMDTYFAKQGITSKERYHLYLQSDDWKALRKKKLKEANYACQLCNSGKKLQTHHRTYENLFNEDLADLVILCDECHAKFHDKLPKH